MEILQPLLDVFKSSEFQTAVANVLIMVVTGVIAVIGRATLGTLRARTTDQQFTLLQDIAGFAVKAAEQAGLSGRVTDKKASAINIVQQYLTQYGITGVTAEQIDAAIESAVLSQFNLYKTYPSLTFELPTTETTGDSAAEGANG